MVRPTYDVAVVGLGAMGSAAAYHLVRRGARVVGLDRFTPPHTLGSTHGQSRIIREAYYEHPLYVPLVQRAYALWDELATVAERDLFVRTGGLMAGPADGVLVEGTLASARRHGLPHEVLDATQIRHRFPGYQPDPGTVGVLEPRAGLLLPEACVESFLLVAQAHGAELRFGTAARSWEAAGDAVVVHTTAGPIAAGHVILAAGPWMPELLAELRLPLEVERQVSHWMEPLDLELCRGETTPIALWEYAPDRVFATFPDIGHGIKALIHHGGTKAGPDRVERSVMPEDEARTRQLLRRFWPAADGRTLADAVCLYTNTPDRHFLLDRHPRDPRVIIASPCSGHGFKFASVIGQILADLTVDGGSAFDLTPFRIGRFHADRD